MPTVAERIADGNDYVSSHVYALEAATVNDLYREYQRAYAELQREVVAAFARTGADKWTVQDLAARNYLMDQIARQMAVLNQIEAELALSGAVDGYKAGNAGTGYILDTSIYDAMGMGAARLPLLPNEAIRAQLLAPYAGETFSQRFRDNRAEFELKIKRSLVQSQIQGEGVYQAQRRIADALGVDIGRRTKAAKASNQSMFAKTEMIARTELLRASNNGALAVYEANQDVLSGWEFKTAVDDRVCPECAALDGKQYEFGKGQRPPIHPRCRCSVLPILIDKALQDAIAGPRVTFSMWAAKRGLTKDAYGDAYELRGVKAPAKRAA